MKALVFGASGFVGRHFTAAATRAGWTVTPVGRAGEGVRFDLDRDEPPEDIAPHDVAVFLAQSPDYGRVPEGAPSVLTTNVVGLARALEMARHARVGRFLYASSGSVYPPAWGPIDEASRPTAKGVYARSKRWGEELVDEWARWFPSVSLRFFAPYGADQEAKLVPNLIARLRAGQTVTLAPRRGDDGPARGFTTSPCHIDDAVDALLRLAESDAVGPVNVAGPEALGIREMVDEIGRQVGRTPRLEVLDAPREGDLIADVSRLREWTGLPRVRFSEGIRRTLAADAD